MRKTLKDWDVNPCNDQGLELQTDADGYYLYMEDGLIRLQVISDIGNVVLDVPLPITRLIAINSINSQQMIIELCDQPWGENEQS